MTVYKTLFGPVTSRRLGISLGVDLVPYKVCSLDCVYCECGATTDLTLTRKVFVETELIINELHDFLSQNPPLDYITFSGSGEPTLAANFGEIAIYIKQNFPAYKLALLTNATLFSDPQVRKEASFCDLVIPSLDAVSQDVFTKVNRPAAGLTAKKYLEGLLAFAKEYQGELWLEIFVVPGINDTPAELNLIKEAALQIAPQKIQLNTLDRPGTENWVKVPAAEQLAAIRDFLAPLQVVTVGKVPKKDVPLTNTPQELDLLISNFLRRRPATAEDIMQLTGLDKKAVDIFLHQRLALGELIAEEKARGVFYKFK